MLSKQLLEDIKVVKSLVGEDNPAVLIIDGPLGTGKTTLGAQIGDEFNGLIPFEQFIGMGNRQFSKVYDENKKKIQCILYDEAGDYSRVGSITRTVQNLNRIFDTFRQYKLVIVLILPRFYWLQSHIFELGVVKILINCKKRKHKEYTELRVYYPDRIDWLVTQADNLKKMRMPQKLVYGRVRPNRHDYFTDFDSEKRKKELYAFSLAGKDQISQDVMLDQEGLLSRKDIATRLGRSEVWLKKKCLELKIKPSKMYKNRMYYSNDILAILSNEVGSGNGRVKKNG
jgi:hypothetical protein